ncbi:MAG: regulatory iron-sulfur-containing complex subunit RicT [Phycisphaerae bacterium]
MTDVHETRENRPQADAAATTPAESAPEVSDKPADDPSGGPAGEAPADGADDSEQRSAESGGETGRDSGDGGYDTGGDGGGADTASREKTAKRERPTLVIRYGRMRFLGRFRYDLDRWRRGQRAVIKSERGIEIGTIVCRWVDGAADDLKVKGEVLRLVTHSDEVDERHLEKDADREFAFCRERIAARNLPMKLVAVEHLFGGDRIIFYFVAEKRVDFRALVRDLAREFQTRIEMRQIGVRDEARLLGDFERCGRPLCCRAFIRDLEPVSMKMAKVQKATLDPSKISGRCGRLMCCLRFEHATYRELQKNLPRKNKEVGTAVGRGKVIGTDVVTQTATVLLEGGTRVVVPVETLVPADEAGPAGGTAAAQRQGGKSKKDDDADGATREKDAAAKKGDGGRKDGDPKKDDSGKKGGGGRRRRSKGKRRGRKNSKGSGSDSGGGRKAGKSDKGGAKA